MKTINATSKGIAINYEHTNKSSFIRYEAPAQERLEKRLLNKPRFYEMNQIQRSMYRRLLYGINDFTPQEISTMNESTIHCINRDHRKAMELVNKMKYEIVYGAYNKLLAVMFPKAKFSFYTDGQDVTLPTLKELKIGTFQVVDCWINGKLLPENFYCLNTTTLKL